MGGRWLESSCSHIHLVSPPAFVVLADMALQVSLALWTVLLAAYAFFLLFSKDAWGWQKPTTVQTSPRVVVNDGDLDALHGTAAIKSTASADRWMDLDIQSDSVWGRMSRQRCCRKGGVEDDASPSTAVLVAAGKITAAVCARLDAFAQRCGTLVAPIRFRRATSAVGALMLLCIYRVALPNLGSYEVFEKNLDACWGFLLRGDGVEAAPVWLSEFGTDNLNSYWSHILRYIGENEVDFAYWPINGQKELGRNETYGLLTEDHSAVRNPRQVRQLQEVIQPLAPKVQ